MKGWSDQAKIFYPFSTQKKKNSFDQQKLFCHPRKKKKKKMSTIEQIAGMGCFCSNMKPCRILTSKNGEQMGVCPNWTKENPVSCGMYLRPSSLTCNCHDDLTGRKYPITWTRNSVWKDGRTGRVLGCIRKKKDPRRCNFKTQYEEAA